MGNKAPHYVNTELRVDGDIYRSIGNTFVDIDLLLGTYKIVADMTERDNIPAEKRMEGLLCRVLSTGIVYKLEGGITNSDWKDVEIKQTTVSYVNINATGNNDGTSWTNAYTDLQDAIANARFGQEIWVAAGIYKPTATTDRTISFVLGNKIKFYGGFAGTELFKEYRNVEANETILDGDIGTGGVSTDNTHHVVNTTNVYGFYLDGFTIRNGYNQDAGLPYAGGLIVQNAESVIIRNCKIHDCYSTNGAGLVAVNTKIFMENVEIYNCTSTFYSAIGIPYGEFSMIDCNIHDNVNTNGVTFSFGNPSQFCSGIIKNCIFKDNASPNYSEIYIQNNTSQSTVIIEGCLFDNVGGDNGVFSDQAGTLTNVAFINNVFDSCLAQVTGRGIISIFSATATMRILNNTFIDSVGTSIFDIFISTGDTNYLYNNLHVGTNGRISNGSADTHVKNCKFTAAIAGAVAPVTNENNIIGDSSLNSKYYALDDLTIIDAGNVDSWNEVIEAIKFIAGIIRVDYYGYDRVSGGTIDIGCVENPISSLPPVEEVLGNGSSGNIVVGNITRDLVVFIDYSIERDALLEQGRIAIGNRADTYINRQGLSFDDAGFILSKNLNGNEIRLGWQDIASDGFDGILKMNIYRQPV